MTEKYSSIEKISENDLGDGFYEYCALKSQKGIKERLTVIDSPGYNPNSKESSEFWLAKAIGQIEGRFQEQLTGLEQSVLSQGPKAQSQSKLKSDKKIHLILHLIDGSEITVQNARIINEFSQFCAIIPVLSKGDTIEPQSVKYTKDIILMKADTYGMIWYKIVQVCACLKCRPCKAKNPN